MGRIFKRKDRDAHWWIDYIDARGTRKREKASRDKSVATRMLAEAELKAEKQRAGQVPMDATDDLEEIRARYWQHMERIGRKQRTLESFDSSYRNLITRNGWKTMRDIRPERVEKWAHDTHTFDGVKGTRSQTINLHVTRVKGMLDWACKNGITQHNPLAGWVRLPSDSSQYRRELSNEEISKLLAAAANLSDEWHVRMVVYVTTALRSTAGASLKWDWINWTKRELVLPAKNNKSKKDHRIPMNDLLTKTLMDWRASQPVRADGRLFKPMTARNVLYVVRRLCKDAGVDPAGVCTHSTRHTVATMAYYGSGCDIKAAQDLLGHASIATTEKYIHADEGAKRRGVESLNFGTHTAPDAQEKSATA